MISYDKKLWRCMCLIPFLVLKVSDKLLYSFQHNEPIVLPVGAFFPGENLDNSYNPFQIYDFLNHIEG